jgi:hypothetical protein
VSKTSAESMQKAKAQRDKLAAEANAAEVTARRLAEKIRIVEEEAKANGVDLTKLPTKAELKAQKQAREQAVEAKRERKAAEADKRKPTAQRMAEALAANPVIPLQPPLVARRIPRTSAERMAAHLFEDGVLGQQADPSRNVQPTSPFLLSTAEVLAGQRVQGRTAPTDQPQYRRPVGQQRTQAPAQARVAAMPQTARNPLHRPWGSAPGQLTGVHQKAS